MKEVETVNSCFRMIDIAEKKDTHRRAVASGKFFAAPETLKKIQNRTLPKGDVLVLAEVAGIQGAKQTSHLLPLCHPLNLTSVRVWSAVADESISVFCEVKTLGKTGVEMEALCGVNAALLCIYDLTKGVDPALRIGEIQLEIKEGGKSGQWLHPGSSVAQGLVSSSLAPGLFLEGVTAAVLTLSDRCSRGETEDQSGPIAARWLEARGARVSCTSVIPDDAQRLRQEILNILETQQSRLIVTSGGTGLSHRDITPETVLDLARERGGREIPGMGELLRKSGAQFKQSSWLSRSTAVQIQDTVVLCLPGSPRAVEEGLDAIGSLIQHSLHMIEGHGHG